MSCQKVLTVFKAKIIFSYTSRKCGYVPFRMMAFLNFSGNTIVPQLWNLYDFQMGTCDD